MKVALTLILLMTLFPAEARTNWKKYLKCPSLSAAFLKDSDLIEIETLETTKDNAKLPVCVHVNGGDCFNLIPKEKVIVSSGYDFKVNTIEIQIESYGQKICSYEVNDI